MTAALARLVRPDVRTRCGVEQEFAVHDAAGRAVDVRERIDGWALGRRLDPGDPHAARGSWGGVVTADGPEAEVVTPPVVVGHGAAAEVHAWAAAGRAALSGRLPAGWTLAGYSTHVSTSVDDDVVVRAARLVVTRLAPALMLLLDGPDSPGVLVRPRPGRLEICGEYTEGRALRHATAVAVAASGLAADAARSRRTRALLPPPLRVRTQPAVQRYGTYVDRRAFGPDLYREGRRARLRVRGGTTTAGDHLARTVDLLGPRLAELLDADDLAALHAVVAGDLPLPLERGTPELDDAPRAAPRPLDLRPHTAPRIRAEVVTVTWWTYVLRLDTRDGSRWLSLPGSWIEDFLDALHAGRLDDVLADLAGVPAGGCARGEVGSRRSQGMHPRVSDPFELQRFVDAQAAGTYEQALTELRAGAKRSHWMWFVFPQVAGLGRSPMAQRYAIAGLDEARAYLGHPVLGPRLVECARVLTGLGGRSAEQVFGSVDAVKLRSSMTLFVAAAPDEPVFGEVLDRYFAGAADAATTGRL